MRARLSLLLVAYGTTLALWAAARHTLPAPPAWDPADLQRWWTDLGPVTALFSAVGAAVSVAAAVGSVLLTAAVLVGVVARTGRSGSEAAGRVLDRYRRGGRLGLVRWMLGVSLSGGALVGCAAPSGAAARSAPGPAGRLAVPAAPVLVGPALVGPGPGMAMAPRAPENPSSPGPVPVAAVSDSAVPHSAAPRAAVPRAADARPEAPRPSLKPGGSEPLAASATWSVRAGEDFWSIAQQVVSEANDPGANPALVGNYWARLVAVNRLRLPVPGNPDLLFPGDILILPPLLPPGG